MSLTDPITPKPRFDWRDIADQVEVIMSEMAVMVTVQDARGRVLYANPQATRTLGFDPSTRPLLKQAETLVRRYTILDQDDRLVEPRDFPSQRVLAGEPWAEAILHHIAKQGDEEYWVMVKAIPLLSEVSKHRFVITIWNDITALKQTEIKLRSNNDRLRTALEEVLDLDDFDNEPRRRGNRTSL